MRLPAGGVAVAGPFTTLCCLLVTIIVGNVVIAKAQEERSTTSAPVHVQLRTPWTAPPLLLEILEATHREEPLAFFHLINHALNPWVMSASPRQHDGLHSTLHLSSASDRQILDTIERVMDEHDLLTDPGRRSTWHLSLALHAEMPKIAAFWQLYATSGLDERMQRRPSGVCPGSWVDFAGKILCNDAELTEAFEVYDGDHARHAIVFPPLSPLDHILSSAQSNTQQEPTAVLYADPFSTNFWELHHRLTEFALGSRPENAPLRYVLRWKPGLRSGNGYLTGFAAYLDLKKVDYLVIDDRKLIDTAAARQSDGQPTLLPDGGNGGTSDELQDRQWLNTNLHATADDLAQSMGSLTPEEVSSLGVVAAYTIAKSEDPLRTMRQLSHDFPSHAVALARSAKRPKKSFVSEIETLHMMRIEAGGEDLWLNGKGLSSKDFQPFGVLSALRAERKLMQSFLALGVSARQGYDLLTSQNISKAYISDDSTSPPVFDASDRIEQKGVEKASGTSGVITYWNDLEALDDPRYAHWPAELASLLRPLYPGSFPKIRRNLFNVILAMDLQRLDTLKLLSDPVQMATNKIAVRWGFVPINIDDPQSPSARLAGMLWLTVDQLGTSVAAKFLRRVAFATPAGERVNVEHAGTELDKLLHTTPTEREALLETVMHNEQVERTKRWIRRLRADEHESGSVFINGQYMPYHQQFLQSLHQLVSMQVQAFAPLIYFGTINDEKTDVSTYFYDLPTTFTARSELLFPPDDGPIVTKAVELTAPLSRAESLLADLGLPDSGLAVWLFGDFRSESGMQYFKDVTTASKRHSLRLGLVPSRESATSSVFSHLCHLASTKQVVSPDSLLTNSFETPISDDKLQACQNTAQFVRGTLDVPDGAYAILINGKMVSNFDPRNFTAADYDALIAQEARKTAAVKGMLEGMNASQVMAASSIVHSAYFSDSSKQGFFVGPVTARTAIVDEIDVQGPTFSVGDPETATLRFSVLINPLGPSVQRWSGVLSMLAKQPDVYVRVILNPLTNVTDVPLKRYYRSGAPHRVEFDAHGNSQSRALSFHGMPQEAVLTMGLDAPPTWLTMPVDAIYDLDNIRLRDAVTPAVRAVYDLKYVLIEGHVRDEVTKAVPRGLQLVLETMDGTQTLDTIVMANLAYFQFRAAPGLYRLRIRPGRSADLYDMVSVGNAGWDSPTIEMTGDSITLDTFQGLTILPRMTKKEGKEKERLVEDEEVSADGTSVSSSHRSGSGSGILQRAQTIFSSLGGSTKSTDVQAKKQADINVFTVASGHLYERMTYIMVLSTIKHTNSTVKFWFIENFLSPSFKSFIPLLAQEYSFDYELVTYAWPHWLREQTEKQRLIWGMKVLFLDVLFPLDLSKVIFVDADQIVRADLMELVQMDLKGAPYGFPPMGNDSYDMDNFRFWETGYWERFLRGKPYPISALFVVDLNRFRLVAAGDKLRGHYQALSADPGSLSNLDQDLVASMIHTVPIYSLPKEWLWCETWCSWDWYDKAKSIDLCSNPKTHEPKLDRARRQIPEWTPLDEEVAAVARRLEEEGKLGANVVASSGHENKDSQLDDSTPPPSGSSPHIPERSFHPDTGSSSDTQRAHDEL